MLSPLRVKYLSFSTPRSGQPTHTLSLERPCEEGIGGHHPYIRAHPSNSHTHTHRHTHRLTLRTLGEPNSAPPSRPLCFLQERRGTHKPGTQFEGHTDTPGPRLEGHTHTHQDHELRDTHTHQNHGLTDNGKLQ